jgi:hypothetical protein
MITQYKKGYPCRFGGVVGRLLGESGEGSWSPDGKFYSIPLFGTPHGTVIKTGIEHLDDMDEEGVNLLLHLEDRALTESKSFYAGYLDAQL